MKILGSLFVILLFSIACMQNTGKAGDEQQAELTDTLHYKTIVLQVTGMTCEGCEKTITSEVGKLEGIAKVSASHVDSVATIQFDTSIANVVLISEKINELGYKVVGEITQ